MRVAHVLAGGPQGGAENFFVRSTIGLNQRPGCEISAFIRKHPEREAELRSSGVETHSFRFGSPLLDLPDRLRFQSSLKKFDPEIVLTWMNRATAYTPNRKRYKLVSRLGHYYNLKYYKHCDYWLAISEGIRKHLINGGFPSSRIFYIPNFADEAPVTAVDRRTLVTPDDSQVILAAGRLHVNKGFDVLLHSMVDLPKTILWLAGTGPEEKSLKELTEQLGLSNRVHFLGWRNDVTALMKAADIFVCPSRHEGLGSIVMESFAHKCPIVATKSQGPGEVIQHGVTGLLTDIDDSAQLCAAIRKVLESSELATALVQNAYSDYENRFSKKVVLDSYQELYDSLLK